MRLKQSLKDLYITKEPECSQSIAVYAMSPISPDIVIARHTNNLYKQNYESNIEMSFLEDYAIQ